jgi:hypothetical protein
MGFSLWRDRNETGIRFKWRAALYGFPWRAGSPDHAKPGDRRQTVEANWMAVRRKSLLTFSGLRRKAL